MFLDAKDELGMIKVNDLQKALTAGYETDAAAMTGGRALIPQDIEKTLVEALSFKKQDFKLMNLIKKNEVHSTIHEYTRRNEVGDESLVFVGEGADSRETAQTLERITQAMKYLQTYRKITLQMRAATTLEDAEASEKNAGTLTVLKGAEFGCFHGNADVVPEQFNSIIKQIYDAATVNVVDMRGEDMTSADGESNITELARMIYEAGGYATHSFMPPIIAQDVQVLVKDRLRLNPQDRLGQMVVEAYPTPFSGDILVAGAKAGPDKFFRVKALPVAGALGDEPGAPTMGLNATAKTVGTRGFVTATAGTYYYQVFPVNQEGIGIACAAASVAVADGEMVEITITPHGSDDQTGYIVCRSKKDAADAGIDCREMYRVKTSVTAATPVVTNDVDDFLPGTGELVFVSDDNMQPTVQWDQFLPLMKFDLFPTNAAIIPFLIVLFGALDLKVPWYNGVIKNVAYAALDWF